MRDGASKELMTSTVKTTDLKRKRGQERKRGPLVVY